MSSAAGAPAEKIHNGLPEPIHYLLQRQIFHGSKGVEQFFSLPNILSFMSTASVRPSVYRSIVSPGASFPPAGRVVVTPIDSHCQTIRQRQIARGA